MGTTVTEPEDRVGMGEHLPAGVEVPVRVVGEGRVEESTALVFSEQIERQRRGVDALGRARRSTLCSGGGS